MTQGTGTPPLFLVRDVNNSMTDEELKEWLRALRGKPHVPESQFDVGAILKSIVGNTVHYFAGVNVENVDHRLSTHAEEGAASAMITALGKFATVEDVYVMAAPKGMQVDARHPLADSCTPCCGKCRQLLINLGNVDTRIHAFALNGKKDTATLGELLPKNFNFRHWIPELGQDGRQQLTGHVTSAAADDLEKTLVRTGELSTEEIGKWLGSLESFDFASRRSDSVVLKLSNGAYVAGSKLEDAAFNGPSAVQAALAIAHTRFGAEDFVVEQVFTASRLRLQAEPLGKDYRGVSMAEVQCLVEHGAAPDTVVTVFNSFGQTISYTVNESVMAAPTSKRQTFTELELASARHDRGRRILPENVRNAPQFTGSRGSP